MADKIVNPDFRKMAKQIYVELQEARERVEQLTIAHANCLAAALKADQ